MTRELVALPLLMNGCRPTMRYVHSTLLLLLQFFKIVHVVRSYDANHAFPCRKPVWLVEHVAGHLLSWNNYPFFTARAPHTGVLSYQSVVLVHHPLHQWGHRATSAAPASPLPKGQAWTTWLKANSPLSATWKPYQTALLLRLLMSDPNPRPKSTII